MLCGLDEGVNGKSLKIDSEVSGEGGGILQTVGAGDRGRQGYPENVFRAEGIGRQSSSDGAIDTSAQAQDGLGETALFGIVTKTEDEGAVDFLEGVWRGLVDRVEVMEINGAEVGLKGWGLPENLPIGSGNGAPAVKDQLIVPSDEIDVYDGTTATLGGPGNPLLTKVGLAAMPGTG